MTKAGYDIGLDVGGSHIAGALFSGEKEHMRLRTPYPKNEPDKASGIIAQMIEALADAIPEAAEDKLSLLNGVRIAVPGSISRDKRTVLNAYTSDLPVAAREAAIYTGITIAEYYRDMGYAVAVIVDSTSRWAEALREMSGRLEEMPGEEGYPAYLASRLAQFYERAGVVECLGSDERKGSVTAIGAVSPPGGDTSEPVSQATMRIVKVFWALDSSLAYARHFPAINWLTSYSLYVDTLKPWYEREFGPKYMHNRDKAMHILQEEAELQEIVRLVGQDALSPADRLTMETAKMIREDFLQQNAFIDEDAYSSYLKQFRLLDMVLQYDAVCREAIGSGADMNKLFNIPARERIGRAKMVPQDEVVKTYDGIIDEMKAEVAEIAEGGEDE